MWGETARSSSVVCLAAVGNFVVSGTVDGKLIVWEGHSLRGVISERKNPHRQLYKDIQDDSLRSKTKETLDSNRLPLCLEPQNEAVINCLHVFETTSSASAYAAAAARGVDVESTTLRMLSGDDSGLIVLWACLPNALTSTKEDLHGPITEAHKPTNVDRLLCPLLMISTGQLRETYDPLGQTRLPDWIKMEVGGIDATNFADRYDSKREERWRGQPHDIPPHST